MLRGDSCEGAAMCGHYVAPFKLVRPHRFAGFGVQVVVRLAGRRFANAPARVPQSHRLRKRKVKPIAWIGESLDVTAEKDPLRSFASQNPAGARFRGIVLGLVRVGFYSKIWTSPGLIPMQLGFFFRWNFCYSGSDDGILINAWTVRLVAHLIRSSRGTSWRNKSQEQPSSSTTMQPANQIKSLVQFSSSSKIKIANTSVSTIRQRLLDVKLPPASAFTSHFPDTLSLHALSTFLPRVRPCPIFPSTLQYAFITTWLRWRLFFQLTLGRKQR